MNDTEKKCDICGSKFESSDKLDQHKESHKEKNSTGRPKVSQSSRYKATGIAAAAAVIIVLMVYFSDTPSVPTGNIQGVECDPLEGTVFHVHAHLDLIVDSKQVTIPAGIGIKPNECLYWLHTHNTSGVIHIESPTQSKFTLGQFIQVWDDTPGISPTFEELTHGDKNLKVFVNGTEVNDRYDTIQLSAHDEIVLVSGDVPPSVPSSYEFGGL
ncbi:MAG: hypothetical protein ACYDAJ_05700 [Nitrosotalea sp.]